SDPVPRPVPHDPQEPRAERRARTEPGQRVVHLHEGLLHRVFRLSRLTSDEPCDAIRDALVARYELLVRVDVTVPGEVDELRVLQWSALHGTLARSHLRPHYT